MSEQFLTIEQAARQLQVHPYTLRRWVREGKIRAVKISRHYRISPDALKPPPTPFVDEAPQPLKGAARRAAIAALKGKYSSPKRSPEEIMAAWARACGSMAHLSGDSSDFLAQKRIELEKENARFDAERETN